MLLAAAVEANSEHPLAAAVVGFAQSAYLSTLKPGSQQAHQPAKGSAAGGVQLPACRDVQVTVGQGIAAWVHLPAAAAGSPVPNGDSGSSGDTGMLQSREVLLKLQFASASPQAPAAANGVAAEVPEAAAAEVHVAVGSRRLVAAAGLLPAAAEAYMQEQEGLGRTCVLVAVGGAVVAALAIQDPLKPEARYVWRMEDCGC